MDVAGQGGEVPDPSDMILTVQDRLIEMGDALSMGDVVPELGTQTLGGLAGVGVALGPKRRQQLAVGVEGKIAVHHG
jgi:hypothetical protein